VMAQKPNKSLRSVQRANGSKSGPKRSNPSPSQGPAIDYLDEDGNPWNRADRGRIRYLNKWDKVVEASKYPKPMLPPPPKVQSD